MAFKNNRMSYFVSTRGSSGLMVYTDAAETLAAIKAANYFNNSDVRSFILKQRDDAGTANNNPVPCLVVGSDGSEVVPLILNSSNGNVSVHTGANFLIT